MKIPVSLSDQVNYDKLKREDYSKTHRYPYTSAYFYNSELDRYADPAWRGRYRYNPYYDMYPNRSEYWRELHAPGSYYHRLDPWYLTQFGGWPSRWPYTIKSFDKSEYSRWTSDLHHHYAKQYEADRKTNELLARRDAETRTYDRFAPHIEKNIQVRDGVAGTPPLFLTPTRLYDNADYRDLRRKSRRL